MAVGLIGSNSVGTGGGFPRMKRSGREVHHSASSGAEVENEWSYTSSPTIHLHGVDGYFTSLGANIEKMGSEVMIFGENVFINIDLLFVAVCRYCAVRCIIVICFYLLFSNYSTCVN
jgi:hypothetical protein